MRLVKYWHIKLFQAPLAVLSGGAGGKSHGPVFSGSEFKRLLAEGYSLVEPQRLSSCDKYISLFTSPNPDDREFFQFRIDDIHSMIATPVYEEDEPAKDSISLLSCKHYGYVGAEVRINVLATGGSDVAVKSSDENIVTATYYADGELCFSCVGMGRASVILTKGDSQSSIEITVY